MAPSRTKKKSFLPEISVVIATFNRGPSLKKLLDNLAVQTMDPARFEVVVVDDGSKVPAEGVLAELAVSYSCSMLRQDNAGAAAARHNGIQHARGPVIVIVDDDMEVVDEFLERHLEAHQKGVDVVLGRIVQSSDFSHMPLCNRFQQYQFNRWFKVWSSGSKLPGASLYTGNVSFRRALYDEVGGFDLALKQNEDRELGMRFEKADAKFVFAPEAVAVNGSDHVDFEKWLETSRRYGVLDWQIARKHGELANADPMHFLSLVNPISRPILASVMALPAIAPPLVRSVMAVAEAVDRMHLENLALAGVTLAYGIQYYRGVRDEAGSLKAIWEGWRRYSRKRKRA